MIVIVNGGEQVLKFDEQSEEEIQHLAATIGCAVEQLKQAIENVAMSAHYASTSLIELQDSLEYSIKQCCYLEDLSYMLLHEKREKIYCTYKSKLHPLDKRRSFRVQINRNRARSNP